KMPGQTAQTNALVARIIAEAPSLPAVFFVAAASRRTLLGADHVQVKCRGSDLQVPASAEIVLEGVIPVPASLPAPLSDASPANPSEGIPH
ncbi:UbiD family decarboxylase, partial [Pseudomonas aeruginosa]|nr:UbiD family decarboxylase [Pseudomonas aeruginosa]